MVHAHRRTGWLAAMWVAFGRWDEPASDARDLWLWAGTRSTMDSTPQARVRLPRRRIEARPPFRQRSACRAL